MSEKVFRNKFKERMKAGEQFSACWMQLASPLAAEILAEAGYDLVIADCEHAPISPETLYPLFQAIQAYDCMPMARAPWNDLVAIKRILDVGSLGIHIPYVRTVEECRAAVAACKYPPLGIRGIAASPRAVGFGQNREEYLQNANEAILTMAAIETLDGAAVVEEMCEIEELDGIFIGPMDLSTNMGYFAQPLHEKVQEKIREIEKIVLARGKLLGTTSANSETAKALYDRGYSYVIFGGDSTDLMKYAKKNVEGFKSYR